MQGMAPEIKPFRLCAVAKISHGPLRPCKTEKAGMIDAPVRGRLVTGFICAYRKPWEDAMKVTHLSNSFLVVEAGTTRLVCDPWVGMANEGGWQSFPEYEPRALHALVKTCDAVYISHLHADHFDPAFLRASGLITKPFLIKHYANRTLERRLRALGATDITLMEPFTPVRLGNFELTLVPQMSSNSSALEDEVNYDLDTSLILHDGQHTFFNQVDNPLSLENYETVRAFITERYGNLDLACFVTGAASGYPQAFTAIDRAAEQQRVIRQSLKRFSAIMEIMRPRIYFPAGGTYLVPGRYHSLNRHIAQPSFEALTEVVAGRALCVHIEGGRMLDLSQSPLVPQVALAPLPRTKDEAVLAHSGDAYPHDDYDDGLDDAALLALFQQANGAYLARIRRDKIAISSKIGFAVYDRMAFDDDLTITAPVRARYTVDNDQAGDAQLIMHMDRKLFVKSLRGEVNWNQSLGLALCERRPDIFHPTDDFSINFLVAKD
jgi:UDP-MurNAc hydroxylase